MAYVGGSIFSAARRAVRPDEENLVSRFVDARLAEEQGNAAPEPQTKRSLLNPILASVMRGNAQVQSNARGKEADQKMDEAVRRIKITENGDGTIDVKGAPAEFFEGRSLAAEGKAATVAPIERVETALGTAAPQAVEDPSPPEQVEAMETMYRTNDAAWGERLPRPYEVDKLLDSPDGIRRLTLLLGGTDEHARTNIEKINKGNNRALAKANFTKRLVGLHSDLYATAKPAVDDTQQNRRINAETKKETRRTIEAFLGNNLVDLGSEDDAVATGQQRLEAAGLAWDQSMDDETRATYRGQKRKLEKLGGQAVSTVLDQMRDEDVRGYGGDFDAWLKNKEGSLGVTFSDGQRGAAQARFRGIQTEIKAAEVKVARERAKEEIRAARVDAREARAVAAAERSAREEERKNRNESRRLTADEKKEHQSRIDSAAAAIEKVNDEIVKNSKRYAQKDAGEEERDFLQRRNRDLQQQARKLRQQLDEAVDDYRGLVSREDWDALLERGYTEEDLAAQGLRLKAGDQPHTYPRARRDVAEWPKTPGALDENDALFMVRKRDGRELEYPEPLPPRRLLPPHFKNARSTTYAAPTTKDIRESPGSNGLFGMEFDPKKRRTQRSPANSVLISDDAADTPGTYAHETGHVIYEKDLTPEQRYQFQSMVNKVVVDLSDDIRSAAPLPKDPEQLNATLERISSRYPKAIVNFYTAHLKDPKKFPRSRMYHESFAELNAQYLLNPNAFGSTYPGFYDAYRGFYGGYEYRGGKVTKPKAR